MGGRGQGPRPVSNESPSSANPQPALAGIAGVGSAAPTPATSLGGSALPAGPAHPELSQANHFGPYGRCFRDVAPATEARPYAIQCRGPAVSDLGLCGDHLAEAMTWGDIE